MSVTRTDKEQDSVGIAEALGNFAERVAKKPHKHWYMGLDKNGLVAMFPEENGLPLAQAVKTTIDTIKNAAQHQLLDELMAKKSILTLRDYGGNKREELEIVPVAAIEALKEKLK